MHKAELGLADKLAAESGGKYTTQQIADAMRASGNNAYGESIVAGMLVTNPSDSAATYDKGAAFNAYDGKTLAQVNRDLTNNHDLKRGKFLP